MWLFYPRYLMELAVKTARWSALYLRLRRIYLQIKHDPRRREYTDLALTPISDRETSCDIFQTAAAQAYLSQRKRIEKAAHGQNLELMPIAAEHHALEHHALK